MKKLYSILLGLSCFASSFAQDVIITRDAKKMDTKITEIGVFVVKYKLLSETDGPTYVLPKNKIAAITYSNGRVETYFDGQTLSSDSVPDTLNAGARVYHEPVVKETQKPTFEPKPVVEDAAVANSDDFEDVTEIPTEQKGRYMFGEVKGIRFKVDAAPLFGGHQHYMLEKDYYGFHHDKRYDDRTVSMDPGVEASLSVGYQFNSLIYLGVGFDVAGMDKFDWVALSEFLDFNVHCLRYLRTSPLVGLRLGVSSLIEPDDNLGFFAEPSVGISHRFNSKLTLGASLGYRVTSFDNDESYKLDDDYDLKSTSVSSYFFKVFFSF